MRMEFGKYKGRDIEDVPSDYLIWFIDSNKRQVALMERELARRESAEEASLSMVERLVVVGYRELAKQNHPDIGGSHEIMQQVNAANEALRELIRRNS